MDELRTRRGTIAVMALVTAALTGWAIMPRPGAAQAAPREQLDPDMVFLSERQEHILVWSEDRGAGHRIYAKRIRANGIPTSGADRGEWEATRRRSGEVPGDQRWPAIIDGVLVYSEMPTGESDYDLFAQRLFDNGRPSGLPWRLLDSPGDQKHADVLALERTRGEDYLVVWSEDTRDQGDVVGMRVDYAFRRSRGPAFNIAQGPGTAEDPSINRDPVDNETLLVMFSDDREGTQNIYGVRLSGSGLPLGGSLAGPFPVIQSPERDYAPALLANVETTGRRVEANVLLVWTKDHVTEGPNVMAQRLERNGLPRGRPYVVAQGPGIQAWPAAGLRRVFDRRGQPERAEWLVAWTDDRLGTLDVLGVRVGLFGQVLAREHWLVAD